MALPDDAISDPAVVSDFLTPDIYDVLLLESLESGGIALNNASQGRLIQTWRAWTEGDRTSINLSPISGSPITTLVSGAVNITSVSIAFDSSMAPTLAYVEDGLVKLYWYDSVAAGFVTTSYPGATSAKVSTDDKRDSQEAASDVIFGYTRGGTLYYRQQRDRYLIEYTVGLSSDLILYRMGMNKANRFQFQLQVDRANV